MKIVLCRPPVFFGGGSHPLNIAYIFAALSDAGFDTYFVDGDRFALTAPRYAIKEANIDHNPIWSDLASLILRQQPDLIGFSSYTVSLYAVYLLSEALRAQGYTGQIWAGGVHPTTEPVQLLQHMPGVDGVVVGEGEETIVELARALADGEKLDGVTGIVYRNGSGIERSLSRPLMSDLGKLPIPTRRFNRGLIYDGHSIMTSRGCPFNCHFCDSKNIWTRKARYRPADHVVNEVEDLVSHGITSVRFCDDIFAMYKKHVAEIADEMEQRGFTNLDVSVGSRIDTMSDFMIEQLTRINTRTVSFGIETGSQRLQNQIEKNIDLSIVIPILQKVDRLGIRSHTFFMIGHPGETAEDIDESMRLIREIAKACKYNTTEVNTVCPYPSTPYWTAMLDKSPDGSPFIDVYRDSYKYNHQGLPLVNLTALDYDDFVERSRRMRALVRNNNMRSIFRYVYTNPGHAVRVLRRKAFYFVPRTMRRGETVEHSPA
jgi:anaerobic magnesium-protoporphyrin IX monomethyl ester cyclase